MEHLEKNGDINQLTGVVLGCAFRVSNAMGRGFLEKVYENALAIELRDAGLGVLQQPRIEVRYKEVIVGEYVADLIVEERLVVEVKAVRALEPSHDAQALNYLRCTKLKLALLLNFGRSRIEYRRIAFGL